MAFLPPAVPHAEVRTLVPPESSGGTSVRSALRRARQAFLAGHYTDEAAIDMALLPTHRTLAPAYFDLAFSAIARQQYGMAYVPLREGLRLMPDFEPGWREYGRTLYFLKRYEPAITACSDAVVRDPHDGQAHLIKGLALVMGGDRSLALPSLRRAEALLPGDPLPWRMEGTVLLGLGQAHAGRLAIEQALKRAPGDPQLRTLRIDALRAEGHYLQAAWLWLTTATH